jgi:hypothetical protein
MKNLAMLVSVIAAVAVAQPTLTGAPATDLQPLFNIAPPWLGADVATSIPLDCGAAAPTGTVRSLWLHGDTLVGNMTSDGERSMAGLTMPRNSVATLTSNATSGAAASP